MIGVHNILCKYIQLAQRTHLLYFLYTMPHFLFFFSEKPFCPISMSCRDCWCYSIQTKFTRSNTTYDALLFASFQDAKGYDFSCDYKCDNIFVDTLVSSTTLKCYYRPGKENYAYLNTGDGDAIQTRYTALLILTIISAIFFSIVISIVCFCVTSSSEQRQRCREWGKKIRIKCRNIKMKMCFCCLTSSKKLSRFVYAVEDGDLDSIDRFVRYEKRLINSIVIYGNYSTYPLVIACERGHYSIARYLLLKGANTSDCQVTEASNGVSHYKTALHFASESNNKPLIRLLIRHGCLGYLEEDKPHDFIPVTLLSNRDMKNINLLIEAGYPMHKEAEAIYARLRTIDESDLRFFMFRELENPPPLQRVCRTVIRRSLGQCRIHSKLSRLCAASGGPLPSIIVKYLKLESATVSFSNPCFPSSSDIDRSLESNFRFCLRNDSKRY